MLNRRCPGSMAGTPTLKIKECPECGGEVEVFSNDVSVQCENCGFTVYNDVESCIQWCKYARDCVGEEMYRKLKRTRIAFIGTGNSARSMMAETLAKEFNTSPRLGFVSAGISPADAVDPEAVEVMKEESIALRGKPKGVNRVGLADIFVLVGPEVELPAELQRTEEIRWDIPNPRGKGLEEYRRLVQILKQKVSELIKEVENDD